MATQPVEDLLQVMVDRLVAQFDPESIILFGSHARGTATPDSDIDLLVVMAAPVDKRRKQVEMRIALHDIPRPKDIVVVTSDEVERRRDIIGTVIQPAMAEGRVLYARAV